MTSSLTGRTAILTGASRGFGAAAARALVGAGATVVGVARSPEPLARLQEELGPTFIPVSADATEEGLPERLIADHHPDLLVLGAGDRTPLAPVHTLTWDEFARNWETDTRHAFLWIRAALTAPLAPGSTVVAISSGAALRGSPISGGYAGAKATIAFIARYAAEESDRAGLRLRFATLYPQLTPATEFGAAAAAGYAARSGGAPAAGPFLQPAQFADAVLALATGAADQPEYLLTAAGLGPAR